MDDPKYGMSVGGLTENSAAVKICTDYWDAKITGNWTLAHALRPTLTEKDHQGQYAKSARKDHRRRQVLSAERL